MTEEILEEFCKILNSIDAVLANKNIMEGYRPFEIRLEYKIDDSNHIYHKFEFVRYNHSTTFSGLRVIHSVACDELYGFHEDFNYYNYNRSLELTDSRYWSSSCSAGVNYQHFKNISKYRLFEDTNLIDFPEFFNELKMRIVEMV